VSFFVGLFISRRDDFMEREFELDICISVQDNVTEDEFYDIFVKFIEAQGWSFGGTIREIQDGYYILPNGEKGKHVLEE
jgi:hypothetical protein